MEIKTTMPLPGASLPTTPGARAPGAGREGVGESPTGDQRQAETIAEVQREAARQAARTETPLVELRLIRGGHIEFTDEQGRRVMRVLDSKDVLIYQVPPRGHLTLLQAAELDPPPLLARA